MNRGRRSEENFVLQRFYALSQRQQLAVFDEIRGYLTAADALESAQDKALEERSGAIEAMSAVALELALPRGKSPTTTQFNEVAPRVASGWNVSRVVRAFGRWRVAAAHFEEQRLRPSARQLEVIRRAGRRRRTDDYIAALQEWLATQPEVLRQESYDRFAKRFNETLPPGRLPLPVAETIRQGLRLNFREAVRVAAGEVALEDATPYKPRRWKRLDNREGPHGLIGARDVVALCQKASPNQCSRVFDQPGFPMPALVADRQRLWRRRDVEAFIAGRPFPERAFNELGALYVTRAELGRMCDAPRGRVDNIPGAPQPAVIVTNKRLYLRTEAEAALPAIKEHREKYGRFGRLRQQAEN